MKFSDKLDEIITRYNQYTVAAILAAIKPEMERIIGEDEHGEFCSKKLGCLCNDAIVSANFLKYQQRVSLDDWSKRMGVE